MRFYEKNSIYRLRIIVLLRIICRFALSMHGSVGSLVVAGRLLGLNQNGCFMLLVSPESHSAGTIKYDQTGGEIKRVHVGIAARGEIQAAM